MPAIASIPQFPPSQRAETQEPRASIAASGALAMLADTPEVAKGAPFRASPFEESE